MAKKTNPMSSASYNAIDLALDFKRRGFAVTPVHAKRKNAYLTNWSKRNLTESEIRREFRPDDNVGLVWGKSSGGLVDIDLDCEAARDLARHFLPPTGMKFGRDSAPASHWIYRLHELPNVPHQI